jgi:hypothetical protein
MMRCMEPTPRQQRLALIESTETVIARLLTTDPAARTRDEIGLAARGLEEAREFRPRPPSPRDPRRHRDTRHDPALVPEARCQEVRRFEHRA